MFSPAQYELLDFGDGRKLERFGDHVLDRPSPAAENFAPAHPERWPTADARYERSEGSDGVWRPAGALPESWTIAHGPLTLELKPTPFGHLGVFAEQAANWDWIAEQIGRTSRPVKLLNLFAYTGGATLAAAAAGAEVTHVDAAHNTVAWARRNAELSSLEAAPIRWIVEDAATFAAREVRRGNQYDGVILDPPTYGHGPNGQTWTLKDDLRSLLVDCAKLTSAAPLLLVFSCHTLGWEGQELLAALSAAGFNDPPAHAKAVQMQPTPPRGRTLPSGAVARCAW